MRARQRNGNIKSADTIELVIADSEWEKVFNALSEGIFVFNTNGYLKRVNRGGAEIINSFENVLVGWSCCDIFGKEGQGCIVQKAISERQTQITKISFSKYNQSFLLIAEPIIEDGRLSGVVCSMRSLSSPFYMEALVNQEQQQELATQFNKLHALGQLATGVAHDFNNALTAIFGRAQLMERIIEDSVLKSHLQVIQTAAADAASAIRRIQAFARQSTSNELQMVNVTNLINDSLELTRTRWENDAQAKGLLYDFELETCDPIYVFGSASELREVFVNLIFNAIDAMPNGGQLQIKCSLTTNQVHIYFTDNGSGMNEEIQAKIFEPFYTTKGNQGTGLGLFISRGIIERHKGQLHVVSEVNFGTTFTVILPLADSPPQASAAYVVESKSRLNILVVDNELHVRRTLTSMLSALGHSVFDATNAGAALSMLSTCIFDIVFTDLSMPGMDGWELARKIRRDFPQVQIILVTGYGNNVIPPSGDATLVDYILGKPFDFAQVLAAINKVAEV
jgi:signal transduction histidine kinase